MPAPRRYADAAARQRAYRQRQAVSPLGADIPLPPAIRAMPSHSRWKAMQDKAAVLLATVVSEMETYRDDRSDKWQESDNALALDEKLELVREALGAIEAIA